MFNPTHLKDRAIIGVSGPEARPFLQGLVTNDVMRTCPAAAVYAALLTPQGKIIYDFLISDAHGGVKVDCKREYATDLAARLERYRLRAKITIISNVDDFAVVALPLPPATNSTGVSAFPDPRLPELGYRAIIPTASLETWLHDQNIALGSEANYHEWRLRLGVPDAATDIPPETFFPLDCNFEELHGVDFNKGCYVGQELTSRMKHRATARRRMLPVSASSNLPPAGTSIKIGASEVGEMRGSIGNKGMALIRLDRLAGATEAAADSVVIQIGRPAYPLALSGTKIE